MQKPRISLGLVVYNEASHLKACLDNIKDITGGGLHSIILADNLSTDTTLTIAHEWKTANPEINLHIIRLYENHLAKARNKVLEASTTPWLYFTDADCRLKKSSWNNLLNFLNTAEEMRLGAFGGGNETPYDSSFVSHGLNEMKKIWLGHMNSLQVRPPSLQKETRLLSTSNLAINVEAAQSVSGFDIAFHPAGEDVSLCHRLSKRGYKLLQVPHIEVEHYQNRGVLLWIKKMLNYGKAQVQIASLYPQHFWSFRGLQFLFLIVLSLCVLALPFLIFPIIVLYFFTLIVLLKKSASSLQDAFKGALFIFTSQACYALGEIWGILTLPIFLANNPEPIPNRDNK